MIFLFRNSIYLTIIGLFCCFLTANGQKIVGYSTVDDHSFKKWDIITDDAQLVGSIEATWAVMDDYSEWQVSLGDISGWLRLRRKSDANVWEWVGNGELIDMRTIFPNEFNRWQISNGRKRNDVQTVFNNPEEWSVKINGKEVLYLYTYYKGDMRDWIIENNSDMSIPMQIVNTFLPITQVIPKH